MNGTSQDLTRVLEMYGNNDLGANLVFQGGFINFGYWRDFDLEKEITLSEGVEASKALYQVVFDLFLGATCEGIRHDLVIAEIGCGRGMGCGLLGENANVKSITGIDLNEKQIERAKRINQRSIDSHPGKINFQQGSAENTGLESNFFDVVYSVEASQHFPSFIEFAKEVDRILKPGGCFVQTTFFATDEGLDKILKKRFTTIELGVDRFRPLEKVKAACDSIGFELVSERSIGQEVYYGFDKWMSQLDEEERERWVSDLLKSFNEGLIDYNILAYRKKEADRENEKYGNS